MARSPFATAWSQCVAELQHYVFTGIFSSICGLAKLNIQAQLSARAGARTGTHTRHRKTKTMQKTILLSTAAALLIAGGASAQESKWNIGAGYTYFDASDVELDVINVRGGYDFTEYFGVEGELLVGLEDEDLSVAGVPAEVGLDYGLGIYAKAQYPLAEQVSVYGRLGYAYHEFDASVATVNLDDSSDAFAFGGGLEWAVSGPNAVRLDYTRYEYDGDGDADAFSINYVRRF